MSRVFPEIARVYVDPIGSSQIRITFRDRFSAADVPLSGTGTGVEQILFFVAMVLFSPADRIFLVDEPHVFLHPGAERELVAFLREHSEHSYVCATHSPVFIAAASPDATWLVTRDEHGSRVASVFAYTISRATIFRELGISAGEVALAERILFVEGPSDNDIYPILLSRIGYSLVHHHTSIIRLYGADTARPLKGAIDELERILRIDFQVCLDGDKEASFTPSPRVRFLSVPEIESLFLLDPVGVHTVFSAIANEANAEGAAPSVPRMTVEQVAERVRTAPPQAKAAHVLRGIARKMGIKYNKAVHGVKLAEAISETALAPFRQTFNDWLQ
jgi:energy-coupling factor transporter ATP-binding protein EcfA2